MGNVVEVDPRALQLPPYYVRADTSDDLVRRYAEALEAGAEFPPVIVARHNGGLVLLDGAHRQKAHLRRGHRTIRAEVVDVPPADFTLEAFRRNARHGTPLTEIDERRTVHELRRGGVPFARIVEATSIPLHRLEKLLVERTHRAPVRTATAPVTAARTVTGDTTEPGRGRGPAEGSGGDAIERALVELTEALGRRDLLAVPPDILTAWRRRAQLAADMLEEAMVRQARQRNATARLPARA